MSTNCEMTRKNRGFVSAFVLGWLNKHTAIEKQMKKCWDRLKYAMTAARSWGTPPRRTRTSWMTIPTNKMPATNHIYLHKICVHLQASKNISRGVQNCAPLKSRIFFYKCSISPLIPIFLFFFFAWQAIQCFYLLASAIQDALPLSLLSTAIKLLVSCQNQL